MPILTNAKHEIFAQELAKGETADAAYQTAGYRANRGNATTLKANQSVEARVAEILERSAKRTEITVAGLTETLIGIIDKAKGKDDAAMLSVARAAVMDAAKLNGLVIDKVQADQTIHDARDLSDGDLAHIAGSGSNRAAEATGRPN